MKYCPKCGAQMDDAALTCPNCGAPMGSQPNAGYTQQPYASAPAADPYDHTSQFDPQDISENKVICMLAYLMGAVGIIIGLLAGKDSKYVAFHIRQALKLEVTWILLGISGVVLAICAALLAWTVVIPILAGIAGIAVAVCFAIVFVLKIICFFQICAGKAKEPAIIRSLGFLK